ncbi:MAG: hypothetical protein MI748_12470 [Opitutales bacterium]|nr:hypothetical protein [Opitutales bacterium]
MDEEAVTKAAQVVGNYMLTESRNSLYNRIFHGDLLLNEDLAVGEVYDLSALSAWLKNYNRKKADRNRIRLLRNSVDERNQLILERAEIKLNEARMESLPFGELFGASQEKIDFSSDDEWICKYIDSGCQLELELSEVVDFYKGSMVRKKIDNEGDFRNLIQEYVIYLCKLNQIEISDSIEKKFYKLEEQFFCYNTTYNLYIDKLKHSGSDFLSRATMESYKNVTEECDAVFEVEFFWFNDRRSAELSKRGRASEKLSEIVTVSVNDEHYKDVILELCRIEKNKKSDVYKKNDKYFYFIKLASSETQKIPFELIQNEMEEQLMKKTISDHMELYLKTLRGIPVWYSDQISWIWE